MRRTLKFDLNLLSWSLSCDSRLPIHLGRGGSEEKLTVTRFAAFAVLANDPHRAPLSHPTQHHFHVPLALQPVILHLLQEFFSAGISYYVRAVELN